MKKFLKFLCGLVSFAAVSFGAYCVYKKVLDMKDSDKDDDDDLFEEDEIDESVSDREYVSINITGNDCEAAEGSTGSDGGNIESSDSEEA